MARPHIPHPSLWPPRFLRYLLIWPLLKAYRRRTRTSLPWRLAGSHFGTVLLSVVMICVVGIVGALIIARVSLPSAEEAALEAMYASKLIEGTAAETPLTNSDVNVILKTVAAGQINYNTQQEDITIEATVGRDFQHIRSISLLGTDGVVVASSDPELIGQPATSMDSMAWTLFQRALNGETNNFESRLSGKRADGGGIVGTFPMRDSSGVMAGVILVDKSEKAIPEGFKLIVLVLSFVAQIGAVLLILVGVPAIPIGIIVGIRRARAISRPVFDLARAAGAFASGDLNSRVKNIRGDDELAALQHGFNNMADLLQTTMTIEAKQRDRAEQALIANRDLVANVSHELRTPVALIRGHLEALEDDPESRDAYVRIALREADRLERLVDDLFQLTRLEAHGLELDIAPFDAGSAVRSAVESLIEPARREAGLTVSADVAPGDLTCLGDRLRIEQVLLNLIRNAIHFTPEGGIILITADRNLAGTVQISVRDTGIGIAPEHLAHIFDRFYRAEESRARSSGGAGLGLSIAKELVEAMNGTIAVESETDEGTVFTITLPPPSELIEQRAAISQRNGASPSH